MRTFTYLLLMLLIISGAYSVNHAGIRPENPSVLLSGNHRMSPGNTTDALSGNYTINSTLPTGGINFNSFNDLAAILNTSGVAGPVNVTVAAGTGPYTEQVILSTIAGSSDINTIQIEGNGETLQYLSTNTNERAVLKLNGTDYMSFNNLIFKSLGTGASEYGFTVHLMNGADYNTFTHCHFMTDVSSTSQNYAAFVSSNNATNATSSGLAVNYLTIDHCIATGGYYCLVVNGPTVLPWSVNNSVTNTLVQDFYQFGLYLRGQNNSVFTNNEIKRPARQNISTTYMLYFANDMSGSKVTENHIHTLAAAGVTTTSTSYGIYGTSVSATQQNPLLVANNLVYGFTGMNGGEYGIYLATLATAPTWVNVFHNTVALDNTSHPGGSLARGIYHAGAMNVGGLINIKNNIIYVTTNSTGNKHCLYFLNTAAIISSDYNVLYNGASAGSNHMGLWNSVNYPDLAAWQTAGFDFSSIEIDPQFADLPSGDIMPQQSQIDNMGMDLLTFVPADFYGTARTSAPDPGAIEFAPFLCPVPVGLTATEISAKSALLGWADGLNGETWNLEWGVSGFALGSGNMIHSVESNSYLLNYLNPSNGYDFYVQADCGEQDKNLSEWAGPYTFTSGDGQLIMIPEAGQWGYISSYINLDGKMLLENVLEDITDEMVIMLGTAGIYWPGQNINTLGEWDTYQGYKLKMGANGHLVFAGNPVENKTVTFPAGTFIIPVLSEQPVMAEDIFNPADIVFAFDLNGNVYWPQGGIYTLDFLMPGYGYLVRFNNATTLDFSSEIDFTFTDKINQISNTYPLNNFVKTGEIHLIGISTEAVKSLKPGDITGVFDAHGVCVGAAVYPGDGKPFVVVAYGDDPATGTKDGLLPGEPLNMKIFSHQDEVSVTAFFDQNAQYQQGTFVADGLSLVSGFKTETAGTYLNVSANYVIYPNPSDGLITITGIERPISLEVLQVDGHVVLRSAINSDIIDLTGLPRGMYMLKLLGHDALSTSKIVIQ